MMVALKNFESGVIHMRNTDNPRTLCGLKVKNYDINYMVLKDSELCNCKACLKAYYKDSERV
jgi:hypothetical protein